MKKNYILVISCILLLITCSDDAVDQQTNFVEIEIPEYYGTYLYNDNDCGGSDIQYATMKMALLFLIISVMDVMIQ